MVINYTDSSIEQRTVRYIGIRRANRQGTKYQVEILEREYADESGKYFTDDGLPALNFEIDLTSIDGSIAMRDMQTFELTGQSKTMLELVAMIQSLYLQKAIERDLNNG